MEEMTLEQANKIINKVTDDGLEKIASYLHYIIYNSDDKNNEGVILYSSDIKKIFKYNNFKYFNKSSMG